jgi:hypothetical protein
MFNQAVVDDNFGTRVITEDGFKSLVGTDKRGSKGNINLFIF